MQGCGDNVQNQMAWSDVSSLQYLQLFARIYQSLKRVQVVQFMCPIFKIARSNIA